MTKKETKEFIAKYFDSFALENGFKPYSKKLDDIACLYIKEYDLGRDVITFGMYNYAISHQIFYHYGKFFNSIEQVVKQVNDKIKLTPPYSKELYYTTLSFGYESLNGVNKSAYLPFVENEEQVKNCIDEIIAFSKTQAFPLLDKMNDLYFLNKEINGTDFWESSWQKKYALSNFDIKRLIIAKLAGSPNFDEIVDKNYKAIEKASAENGYPFIYDRNDLNKPIPHVLEILKNHSQSLT